MAIKGKQVLCILIAIMLCFPLLAAPLPAFAAEPAPDAEPMAAADETTPEDPPIMYVDKNFEIPVDFQGMILRYEEVEGSDDLISISVSEINLPEANQYSIRLKFDNEYVHHVRKSGAEITNGKPSFNWALMPAGLLKEGENSEFFGMPIGGGSGLFNVEPLSKMSNEPNYSEYPSEDWRVPFIHADIFYSVVGDISTNDFYGQSDNPANFISPKNVELPLYSLYFKMQNNHARSEMTRETIQMYCKPKENELLLTGAGSMASGVFPAPLYMVNFPDPAPVPEVTYPVSFTVKDTSGSAVEGAKITLIPSGGAVSVATLTTDAQGKASKELADGTYTAKVTKTGMITPDSLSFTVSGTALAVPEITMEISDTPGVDNADIPKIAVSAPTVSNQYGSSATVSVSASINDEGKLSYQWYQAPSSAAIAEGGTKLAGAVHTAYATDPIKEVGTRKYYCVVTNTNDTLTNPESRTTAQAISPLITVNTTAAAPDRPIAEAQAGRGKLNVSWRAPKTYGADITKYQVSVATDAAFASCVAGYGPREFSPVSRSTVVTGLQNGTTYYVKVTAVSAAGNSTSDVLTVTPEIGETLAVSVPSGAGGTVRVNLPDGTEADLSAVPKGSMIKLYAKPEEGKRFIRWNMETAPAAPAVLMAAETGDPSGAADTAIVPDLTSNPLTVIIDEPTTFSAVFANLEVVEEAQPFLSNLAVKPTAMSGSALTPRPLTLVGSDGVAGFRSELSAYDLYFLSTDNKTVGLDLRAISGSAVTLNGTPVSLTEAAVDGEPYLKAVPELTFDPETLTSAALAVSRGGVETVYTINAHFSEAKTDPKTALELNGFAGSTKAELTMFVENGFFDSAQFNVKLTDNTHIKGFTNEGGVLFNDASAEQKDTAGTYKDLQTDDNRVVNPVTLKSDGNRLEFGVKTTDGLPVNLTGGKKAIAKFYLELTGTGSLEDCLEDIQVETVEKNTMYDVQYIDLKDNLLNDRDQSLVYLKLADLYRISGFVLTDTNPEWVNFNVYDGMGDLITEGQPVPLSADQRLSYMVSEGDYQLNIFAPGYLEHQKTLSGIAEDIYLKSITLWAGDVNGNGIINQDDVDLLLSVFNQAVPAGVTQGAVVNSMGETCFADFNNSGTVNALDLGRLLSNFGKEAVLAEPAPARE